MKPRTIVIILAIVLASLTRITPHPPNFSPLTAMALFGAATLADRRLALVLPLLALFVSDFCVGVMYKLNVMHSWGFHSGMVVIYLTFLMVTLLGFLVRRHRTAPVILGTTLAGSVLFYLVTNFAVWVGMGEALYPHTLEGLLTCYEMAVPFFWNTLLGDVVYATGLFGGFALATHFVGALRDPVFVQAAVSEPG
jgi:hypothetical protein